MPEQLLLVGVRKATNAHDELRVDRCIVKVCPANVLVLVRNDPPDVVLIGCVVALRNLEALPVARGRLPLETGCRQCIVDLCDQAGKHVVVCLRAQRVELSPCKVGGVIEDLPSA